MGDTNRKTYKELKSILDRRRNYMSTDISDVNDDYIKSFMVDSQKYFNDAQGIYDAINWGNASTTYDERNASWQALAERANKVGAYYYRNRKKYKNYDDIASSIDEILSGGANQLTSFSNLKDYYSQWDSQEAYDTWKAEDDLYNGIRKNYDYANMVEKGKNIMLSPKVGIGGLDLEGYNDYVNDRKRMEQYLNDDELGIYYYYLGSGKTKEAEDYFKKYSEVAKYRAAEGKAEKWNNTHLGELAMAFGSGVDSFVSGMKNLNAAVNTTLLGVETDVTTPTVSQYGYGIMSADNKGIDKVAVDSAQTIANQLPSMAVGGFIPGAGNVVMGMSAAGNAYAEMSQVEGVSKQQALNYGITIGVLEGVLQKVMGGISGLGSDGRFATNAIQKALPNITSALGKFALTTGANMFDEGFEEALQEVLDPIVQGIMTGTVSDDQDEIFEILSNASYSFLLGAVSAGTLEGIPSFANSVSTTRKANKQYSKISSDIVAEILEKNPNDSFALKMQGKLNKGKKLSGGNVAALVERGDRTAIESAIANKLTERGERGDISQLSQVLAKEAMGYGLSKAETRLIQSSDFGRSIQAELNPSNLSNQGEIDRWAEKIGTREVNPKQYNKQVEVKGIKEDGKVELESGKVIDAKSVSFNNEADEIIFKTATERVGRVDGWTNESANAMVKGYDGNVSALEYRQAYVSAFDMGKNGAEASQIVALANQTGIKGSTLLAAYDMGKQATEKALTNDTDSGKIESEVKTDESTGLRLRDSSKRDGSKDSQKQVSGVEESTGRDTSREDTEGKVADSEAVKLVNEGRKVKVSELGILNGSKAQTVTVVDKSQETSEMKRARKEAEKRGLKVRFFLGDNLVIEENGELISVRGYIKGEYVFVRADHPLYTSYQLMRHEIGHDMIAKGEVDINKVRAKLEETVGKENIDTVADMYALAYENSGLDADAIWEECICDSLGDMNVFSDFADIDQGIIAMVLGDIKQATEDTKTAPNKTRGAPEGKASAEIIRKKKSKVPPVDEFATQAMIWAFSAGTNPGDIKVIYNAKNNTWNKLIAENTESRYAILLSIQDTPQNAEAIRNLYDEVYNDNNNSKQGTREGIRNDYERYWDLSRNGRDDNINAEKQISNGQNGDIFGGEPRSNGNRNSQQSARDSTLKGKTSRELDSDYLSAVERGDVETAQRMVDEAAKKAGYNYHLYHGTDADFTKFDLRKHGGENGKGEGYGIYLAANREISAPYGKNVIDSYVKFNRLAEGREKTLSYNEVKKLIKRSCELEAKQMVDDEEYDSITEALKDTWVSNVVYTYGYSNIEQVYADVANKLWEENDNDGDLINEMMALSGANYDYKNALKFYETILTPTTNIDGFHYIWGNKDGSGEQNDIYLAFNSEQVKSADPVTYDDEGNVIPLSQRFNAENEDIRYSRDLDIEGDSAVETKPLSNRELLANALLDTVQNEVEYKKLDDYKAVIKYLEAEETKLESLKEQIRSLDYNKDKAKFKELREEIRKTEARIDFHDKKLLQLESTQALKNVLERAKKEAYSKALAKGRETLHANVEGRHKTIERNRIKDIAHELDNLLNKGTKKRNVKMGAQPIVRALLDITDRLMATDDELIMSGIVTETNSVEEDALGEYRELYNELHSTDDDVTNHKEERKEIRSKMHEVKQDLVELLERERKRISKAKASDSMQTLIDEYHKLESVEEDYLKLAYKPEVEEHLVSLKDNLGDKLVSEMSLDDLKSLHKACTMIYKMVTSSNKLFREGKAEDLHERVSEIFKDVSKLTKRERQALEGIAKIIDGLDGFAWNNLRPVDVFTLIGSPKLKELFWDAINAQDKYGANAKKIGEDIVSIRKKHGYKKWDTKQKITIDTADGKFDVTLGELMSIYAYSMRKQADKHMAEGGFQHKDRALIKNNKGVVVATRKEEHPYRIGEMQRSVIAEKLTKEQRAYVEEMVKYITKYGEKGNEVSRTLYGIDLFAEEVYFPLKSSKDFLSSTQTELGKTQTTSSLSNIGMSKPTVPNANNPIILENFDDVILTHLDEMSKYNAYVIPVENLRKVFDSVDRDNNMALKSLISSRLGAGAERYLQKYITDLNGGVAAESGVSANIFTKGKAASVMMNLSVWAQQWFSVLRAMAIVNPKYFIPFMGESFKKSDMKLYEEMRTYAPITIIKEMGGFDVGSNRGLKEYVGLEETKFNKDVFAKKANDVFGWGANLMDKLGWMTIWKVVKKEVASTGKFKEGSDAYFEACRRRMNEVITETQVYDSVNARSGLMRSKSELNKFLTAFMGEPTVIVGMAEVAIAQYTRAMDTKDTATIKKAASKLASTIVSIVAANTMTSVVKSLVYAMRDDDEDETFAEKYAMALGSAFADDINLLGYIPLGRDFSSIVDGWTVERPDMQLIEDLVKSFKNFVTKDDEDEKLATWEEHIDAAGSIANLLGIPLKNAVRDVKALVNFVVTLRRGYDSSTEGSFKQGFFEDKWVYQQVNKLITGDDAKITKSEKLYSAFVRGDTERLEYYRNTYEDEKSYESAVRKSLRDNDPRVEQAALARLNRDNDTYYNLMMDIIDEGVFDRKMVKEAFEAEYNYQKRLKEEAEK